MQEDPHLTEDALRQALSRIGAGSGRSSRQRDSVRDDRVVPSVHSGEPTRTPTPFNRKRRFSGDNQVIVEHSSQGRKTPGRQFAREARPNGAVMLDGQSDVERLRRELREEKRRCHDAQAEVDALKQRLHSFETRLAHYRIQADEQKKACEAQEKETLRVKAELHQAREHEKVLLARRQSQKRQKEAPYVKKSEQVETQEPVQWWKN